MYSENLYSYIPHGTSQGFVWEISISENLGLNDSIIQKLNDSILARVQDEVNLSDEVNKSIGKVLAEELQMVDEWSYRIRTSSSEVSGRRYRITITGKRHE